MSDNGRLFEDEAHDDDAEERQFQDSSEEEEDDDDNYEKDDFIVDDEGDDAADEHDLAPPLPSTSDPGLRDLRRKKKKKRRRHREDSPELAEGDLQLLEEGGVRIDRRKKLKRLRKGASDEEENAFADDVRDFVVDDDDDDDDDDDNDRHHHHRRNYRDRRRAADEPVDYDDDMDDFIDDGGRKKKKTAEREGLVSSEAVRHARSIFGDAEEMTQYKGDSKLFKHAQHADDDLDEDYTVEGELEPSARPLRHIRDRDSDLDDYEVEMAQTDVRPRDPDGDSLAKELAAPKDDSEMVTRIVTTDIPEQLQNHFGPDYIAPTELQIQDEAEWIYRHGFQHNPDFADVVRFPPMEVKKRIVVVLSYIHIDNLDIPFIAMYRKDYITPFLVQSAGEVLREPNSQAQEYATEPMPPPRGFNSLRHQDLALHCSYDHKRGVPPGYHDGFGDWSSLWHILDLDKRYATIVQLRKTIIRAAEEAREKGIAEDVIENVKAMAISTDVEQGLRDAEKYMRLALQLQEALKKKDEELENANGESGSNKRPVKRKNKYNDYCARGYRDLAREFGLTARQVGENLKGAAEYGGSVQVHVPLEADDEPMNLATRYAISLEDNLNLQSEADNDRLAMAAGRILYAARHILKTEIVADMTVIQTARKVMCKPGTISITTTPTPQGIAQVGENHPLRAVTSLFEKKIESFTNTSDYVLVKRAVEMGFTEMEINLQPEAVSSFVRMLVSAFLVSELEIISPLVEKWNKERLLIVEEVKLALVKQLKEEVEHNLRESTAVVLRRKICNAASRRFLLGPSMPNPLDDACPRVLSFCVTSEDDEEVDQLQVTKDNENAKEQGQRNSDLRLARERVTIAELDENGEYQNGYELFAGWLRRPFQGAESDLPEPVKDQIKSFIARARAQTLVVGLGSGGRAALRLWDDLIRLVAEMAFAKTTDDGEEPIRPPMLSDAEVQQVQKIHDEGYRPKPDADQAFKRIIGPYVICVDEFPARIYAKTKWINYGLNVDALTLLEKRAIGLARLAQEPLWVYCAIGHEVEHALHLKFHPHHYFAKPTDRVLGLRRALYRAVCANGVDINRTLRIPHTQVLVGYVGGLGLHKGRALVKSLEHMLNEEDHGLSSRKHLWSQNHIGKTVFISAAAFLRIRDPDLHSGGSTKRAAEVRRARFNRKSRGRRRDEDDDDICDPMDDSRVHPEHYAVAIKIADEALRDDDGHLPSDFGISDEYDAKRIISALLDDPSGLQRLALDEYAKNLEDRGRGSLYETVKVIASEFKGSFKDWRVPLVSPEPEAIFYLCSGADPMIIRIGGPVTATNCLLRVRRRDGITMGIGCRLPFDLRGFIRTRDFSEKEGLSSTEYKRLIPDGSSLACRILAFNYERLEVVLTARADVLKNPTIIKGYTELVNKDDDAFRPYPKIDGLTISGRPPLEGTGASIPGDSRARKNLNRTMSHLRAKARPIVQHPLFHDIPGETAIEQLKGRLPGDIIIRPSQYKSDAVVFSCKFAAHVGDADSHRGIFHVDCRMDYDPDEDSVPVRLRIDDNIYEDVEQILEQYLRPIISNLTESLDHRKFKHGDMLFLQNQVTAAKRENPKCIPYVIGLSERKPAHLTIVYIPGEKTVRSEEIRVVPDGYKLRSVLHKNLDVLIAWFKKNMRNISMVRKPMQSAIPASPFITASPHARAKSPFISAMGTPAFQGSKSPFQSGAKSPFHGGAKSPFQAGSRSPHASIARSPYAGARSPYAVPRPSGMTTATPARDEPPPPAPPNNSNYMDPYRYAAPVRDAYPPNGPNRRPRHADDPVPVTGMGWANVARQRDEPPPPPHVQNGGYGRGYGRRPGAEPPSMLDRGPRDRRGPPPGPPGGRGGPRGRGEDGEMPAWRGQAPVPAWKKAQESHQ